jgi:DNA repair protein RadC
MRATAATPETYKGLPLFPVEIPLTVTRLCRETLMQYTNAPRLQVTGPEDCAAILREYFEDKAGEEFVILMLNTSNTITSMHRAAVGGLAACIVEPREIFRAAILSNAAAVILAHNHPSGNPEPSREDVRITKQLSEAGKLMGIPVHDHVIIPAGLPVYTSLAERGLM